MDARRERRTSTQSATEPLYGACCVKRDLLGAAAGLPDGIRIGLAARCATPCRTTSYRPCCMVHKRGRPRGSGLSQRRWPVERSNAWVLENRRLALRYDRLGFVIQALLQAACIFLVAGRFARQF
jgi:transposase